MEWEYNADQHEVHMRGSKMLAIEGLFVAILASATAVGVIGCRRPPDTDISSSPRYNFSSFTNTLWKTKVKVALADMKLYTGRHALTLVGPRAFDKTRPDYYPPDNTQIVAVLPAGTRLRIGHLMEDNGSWGGVRVTALLDDGREVNVSELLLAQNKFFHTSSSTNWGVNPETLEAAEDGAAHP